MGRGEGGGGKEDVKALIAARRSMPHRGPGALCPSARLARWWRQLLSSSAPLASLGLERWGAPTAPLSPPSHDRPYIPHLAAAALMRRGAGGHVHRLRLLLLGSPRERGLDQQSQRRGHDETQRSTGEVQSMRRRRRQCSTGERFPHRHCRRPPHCYLPLPRACLRPPPHSPRAPCLQPPSTHAKAAAAALRRRQRRGQDAAACALETTQSPCGHWQRSRDQRQPAAPAALAPSPPCEQIRRAAAAGRRRAAQASTPDQVHTRPGRQEEPQREPRKRPRRAGSGTPSPLHTCPSERSGRAWARKGRLRWRDRRQRWAWSAAQRVGDGAEPGRTQGCGSPVRHGLGGDRTLVCKNGQSTRVQCPRAKNAQGFAVPASDWRRASTL